MTTVTNPLRYLLNRAQTRFVRSRPGSVLILVIALLVLMALIGTAYITMSDFDRTNTQQHEFNVQVDLLLQGVINMTKSVVVDADLFNQGNFRSGNPPYDVNGNYIYYDSLGPDAATAQLINLVSPLSHVRPGKTWLAQRNPDVPNPLNAADPNNTPYWQFITAALNGSGQFDTPWWPNKQAITYSTSTTNPPALWRFVPSRTAVMVDGEYRPAFQLENGAGVRIGPPVLAADADGDGIADSGLFKLPVGTIDGVTYYGAVRIVDNCAAINANVAWQPNPLITPATGALPGDFFPTNIDLRDLLVQPASEMLSLNNGAFRNFGAITAPYVSPYETAWMQSGRRLGNPAPSYQPFSIAESMTMARNFVLRDPSLGTAAGSSSLLEQLLPQSTFNNAPSVPYQPDDIYNWYNQNFDYLAGGTLKAPPPNPIMPLRSLLVAQNPVSNFCPNNFWLLNQPGGPQGNQQAFGLMKVTPDHHAYVNILPGGPNVQIPGVDTNAWVYEPWNSAPTKINVNTGSFGQLWMAYWSVMAEGPDRHAPFPNAVDRDPRMFKSPLRAGYSLDQRTTMIPQLTPRQVMQLRAALAAINTIDLRDNDDDVASREVHLIDTTNPNVKLQDVTAMVYGTEMQPYITEVYANNAQSPSNGYIAIELYNPYPVPISLLNWKLATATHNIVAGSQTEMLTPLASTAAWSAGAPVIAPNSYLVLASSASPPAGLSPPTAMGSNLVVLADLSTAFNQELVILKPRKFNGTPSFSAANGSFPAFDERTNIADLVPVDMYDFTGLMYPNADPAHPNGIEWHYIRPNALPPVANKAWHWVYPGHYKIAAAAGNGPPVGNSPPRFFEGTAAGDPGTTTMPPMSLASLGMADPMAVQGAANYHDTVIQLNNWDMAGPNNQLHPLLDANGVAIPGTHESAAYPFGGFARNADILQVPFIGAYRLKDAQGNLLELNPVSFDAQAAEDDDPNDDVGVGGAPVENIGRFCPIDGVTNTDDLTPSVDGQPSNRWRYHFATRLFDYLTVQSPQQDYVVDVDPGPYDPASSTPGTMGFSYPTYNQAFKGIANVNPLVINANTDPPQLQVQPNRPANPPGATEETAPVHGLININTAPWRVLAAIPWVPPDYKLNGYNQLSMDMEIGLSIARYRDLDDGTTPPGGATHGHGAFASIFELNRVPIYDYNQRKAVGLLRDVLGAAPALQSDYTVDQGNLSPAYGKTDQVTGDFESRFMVINRVSNLITTRSDSYTAYILIQGWRDAETPNPHLVVQRRAAIILDRSVVTPLNRSANVTNIPVN